MRDPDVIVRVSCWTVSYVPEAIHPLDAEAYSIWVESTALEYVAQRVGKAAR